MIVAHLAHELNRYARGRLQLGLGTQVGAHVTRRFGEPFDHPAARMREFVLALRAIWACWNDGAELDFRGEFYQHTLMTPAFNPGPVRLRAAAGAAGRRRARAVPGRRRGRGRADRPHRCPLPGCCVT